MGLVAFLTLMHAALAGAVVCTSAEPKFASLFTYEDFGTYQRVNSTACNGGESYILYPRGGTQPSLGSSYKYFGVPLQGVAATTTVPIAFVEAVGARSAIKVSSQYTTSSCIAKMMGDGDTDVFVSSSSTDATQMAQHVEQMAGSGIEAVISDPWSTSQWSDAASLPKLICEASTSEPTPMGGAEWVKFWGYFFANGVAAADSFCATGARYSCNSLSASSINKAAAALGTNSYSYQVPTVLFASLSWDNKYKIQMSPYKNKMVNDAGAVYPDLSAYAALRTTHWSGSHVDGYNFGTDAAQFHAALSLADVIIDETYPNGQTLETIATKYGLDGVAAATLPGAFTSGRVYTLDGTMDSRGPPYGGIDYYESRIAEPDGLLSDIVAVVHPTNNVYNPAGLQYMRQAETGTIRSVVAADCTDKTAPRPIRAPTCDALAIDSDSILNWLTSFDAYKTPPPASPSPPPVGDSSSTATISGEGSQALTSGGNDDQAALYAVIGTLGGITFLLLVAVGYLVFTRQKLRTAFVQKGASTSSSTDAVVTSVSVATDKA